MSLLRRLRPRRDPLRDLLEERLRKLREQAAREPYKVGSLDVVALWIALRANEDSRRIPGRVILSAALTVALLLFMLALLPVRSEVELSGVASGFSFEIAEGQEVPLLARMSLTAVTATGFDRMVIDGHRELAAPYLVAPPESQPHLLSALRGTQGSRVRIHQSSPGLLRLSFETAGPVTLSVSDAAHLVAGDVEDLFPASDDDRPRGATLIELFPAADEPLELEMEIGPHEAKLAEQVPIRSLRFVETSIDHEHPERSRTVATLGEATLRLPAFPAIGKPIGRGARLDLGEIGGNLEYGLATDGELGFRYQGRVEKAKLVPPGTEVPDDLIPSWFEILQKDRRAARIASAVLALFTAVTTILQLRKLL